MCVRRNQMHMNYAAMLHMPDKKMLVINWCGSLSLFFSFSSRRWVEKVSVRGTIDGLIDIDEDCLAVDPDRFGEMSQ